MNKANTLAFGILIFTLFSFFSVHNYLLHSDKHDMRYAKLVAGVTSILSQSEVASGPIMSGVDYALTEDRGVLYTIVGILILPVTSIIIVIIGRRKYGANGFDLKLIFASATIFVGIIAVIYRTGLIYHA